MNESALATRILEIAECEARGRTVTRIRVSVGDFTGITREALEHSFRTLRAKSASARDADLVVNRIRVSGYCPECDWAGTPARTYCLSCPVCQTPVTILTGLEIQVESIDIQEAGPPLRGAATITLPTIEL